MSGHIKPDAGGVIRAGVLQGSGTLFLSSQRFEGGDSTVDMDLTPEEARTLGRWLIKLANQSKQRA